MSDTPKKTALTSPGFEKWWMEFAENDSSDALDNFDIHQQTQIVGILKIAWTAALASREPSGLALADAIEQCAIESGERSPEGVSSHTMLGDMWDGRIRGYRASSSAGVEEADATLPERAKARLDELGLVASMNSEIVKEDWFKRRVEDLRRMERQASGQGEQKE